MTSEQTPLLERGTQSNDVNFISVAWSYLNNVRFLLHPCTSVWMCHTLVLRDTTIHSAVCQRWNDLTALQAHSPISRCNAFHICWPYPDVNNTALGHGRVFVSVNSVKLQCSTVTWFLLVLVVRWLVPTLSFSSPQANLSLLHFPNANDSFRCKYKIFKENLFHEGLNFELLRRQWSCKAFWP